MNQEKIGKLISKLRKKQGLTQIKLGDMLNVSDTAVSKWEHGKTLPDISILNELCDILKITTYDLLKGEQSNNDITISAIKYYNKKSKLKYIRRFICLIIILIILFLSIFTINNFGRFNVYKISSNSEKFIVNGYVIYNRSKNIIMLNNIEYIDKNSGTENEIKVKEIVVSLKCNKKTLNSFGFSSSNKDEVITLRDYLKDKYIYLDEDEVNEENILTSNLDKLAIEIIYTDDKLDEYTILVPLTLIKDISSNQLFY